LDNVLIKAILNTEYSRRPIFNSAIFT